MADFFSPLLVSMDQNDTCMDVDANASIVTDAVSHDNDTVSVNITDTSVRDSNGANNIDVEVRSQPNAVDVNIPLESNVVNGDLCVESGSNGWFCYWFSPNAVSIYASC